MNKIISYILAFANGFLFGFAAAIFFNVFGPEQEYMSTDRKSTRLNSSHVSESRMPSSA